MKTPDHKQDEVWVMQSMRDHGFNDLEFGPDPPDIIFNKIIGIEVTRLNEYILKDGKFVSVDTLQSAFRRLCQEVIDEFPNNDNLECAFVNYTFYRPLQRTHITKKKVRAILQHHLPFIDHEKEYELDNLEFTIGPASVKFDKRFALGAMNEGGPGAWQPGFAADNLKITLADKEIKLQKYKHLYQECWLALLDCIGYGISDYYMEELRNYMGLQSEFDRIIIFSPYHHFNFNTLYIKNQI